MSQSRNWCFTRQVTVDEANMFLHTMPGLPAEGHMYKWHESSAVKYIVFQLEQAPTTGQLHIQGYVNLKGTRKMEWVKNLIGNNAHVEKAHDPQASIVYCQKEDTRVKGPWKYGVEPTPQGKHTKMEIIAQELNKGKTIKDIVLADPNAAKFERQMRFFKFFKDEDKSDRQLTQVKVIVQWGPSGCGKTYSAINYWGFDGDYYKLDCSGVKGGNLWFDGYDGQRTLILDDFDSDVCSVSFLKNLLDCYKLRLPIKGGHCWAAWTTVIITSNQHPADWWFALPQVQQDALKRRIYDIREYFERGQWRHQNWDKTYPPDRDNSLDGVIIPRALIGTGVGAPGRVLNVDPTTPPSSPIGSPMAPTDSPMTQPLDQPIDITDDGQSCVKSPPSKRHKAADKC